MDRRHLAAVPVADQNRQAVGHHHQRNPAGLPRNRGIGVPVFAGFQRYRVGAVGLIDPVGFGRQIEPGT